jgi:hypothetical protein
MTRTASLDDDLARHLVSLATLAPSVHNTQPWSFVRDGDVLGLRADRSRQLAVLDPDGRLLAQSCGAALHHLLVAVHAAGLDAQVELVPDAGDRDLLAQVTVNGSLTATPQDVAAAVAELTRATGRGRFDDSPLPEGLTERLRADAESIGARLRVVRPEELVAVQVLVSRAETYLGGDPAYRDELAHWVHESDTGDPDGIPLDALDDGRDRAELVPGRAFVPLAATRPGEPPPAERPTLVLVLTDGDGPREWILAGQTLSALMLRCTTEGVAVQPIGQVIDVPAARQGLAEALGVLGRPQMLLRLGRGTSVRRTRRRLIDDVLTL